MKYVQNRQEKGAKPIEGHLYEGGYEQKRDVKQVYLAALDTSEKED